MCKVTDILNNSGIQFEVIKTSGTFKTPYSHATETTWACNFTRGRKTTSFDYFMGKAHKKPPTARDVLRCIVLDMDCGEYEFDEFCDEFGYDQDSRNAEKTWRDCQENGRKLRNLLSTSDIDAIREETAND